MTAGHVDQRVAGLAEARAGRRTLLGAAGGAGVLFSTALGAGTAGAAVPAARTRKRAYVVVIDGCLPEEIDSGLTPNLQRLRDEGLRHPRAASLPVMETIPNHTMMMSGMRPDRTGVPANSVFDRELGEVRTLDRPSDLRAPTLLERLDRRGLRTGTVLSKEYLYGIFGTRATYRWEPAPIVPVAEYAPDEFTMTAAREMVTAHDPHLMFVNLGDIDRFGHSDLSGPGGLELLRRTALANTDRLVGGFVDLLREEGHWEHAIMVVLADHSMDFSFPDRVISLTAPLEADPMLAGQVAIADNGGADLLYWLGPARRRDEAVRRMRAIAEETDGVLEALDRRKASLRLGPEAGDVVVHCRDGWRFSDPDPVTSNPIPGNHGHPATRPIPFFISGGHPSVPRRTARPGLATTADVAPTVGQFFGLPAPRGGYDGRSRL
ncbi:alkaline phosphatase family protein [Nocardioides sp. AX2bis]|uniref:alkaline phosphatase family protein n=1 Tax=Nocardioides sp. AX2bis TaxID=2653157 RepID=UPI0012F2CCC7|nr:nucleotide pyrophosphatase/phosphodiesterase family protein [Nocardioides sp. AX2bis]VXC12031.1 Phosphonoacetate hydrolase [Nocardioides sp. AX2bis]